MSRISLSDLVEMLIAQAERDRAERERLLAALTDKQPRTASETVKIARSGTGDHTTAVAVEVVPQDGESLAEARARAMVEYETICARYPMANGYAHAHELSGEAPTLVEQLQATVDDEVSARRRGKDGAK